MHKILTCLAFSGLDPTGAATTDAEASPWPKTLLIKWGRLEKGRTSEERAQYERSYDG